MSSFFVPYPAFSALENYKNNIEKMPLMQCFVRGKIYCIEIIWDGAGRLSGEETGWKKMRYSKLMRQRVTLPYFPLTFVRNSSPYHHIPKSLTCPFSFLTM